MEMSRSMAAPSPSSSFDVKAHHEYYWNRGDTASSVSAVSFAFVATAILISIFIIIAIFERFLRPKPPSLSPPANSALPDADNNNNEESPGTTRIPEGISSSSVSVVMPGQSFPTFIAKPLPVIHQTKSTTSNNMYDP